MKLSEIGEFGLIGRFAGKFKSLIPQGITGIGDDCAILPVGDGNDLVITTDMLVEDIHFTKSMISPIDLGHKSLAVNLSDIASMGAIPVGSFLSIAIPDSYDVQYLDELMEGYYQLSEELQVPLLGGDTTRSGNKLVLNVCAIGKIKSGRAKLRASARSGDIIAVTGYLGDSAAGLKALVENFPRSSNVDWLIKCHQRANAHVAEGAWLGGIEHVNAMMDISDGIASDLMHILVASSKAACINLDRLPVSPQLKETSALHGLNTIKLATSGGEDYCLLVTILEDEFDSVAKKFQEEFNRPLYPVGNILEGSPGISWMSDGKRVDSPGRGYDHFV